MTSIDWRDNRFGLIAALVSALALLALLASVRDEVGLLNAGLCFLLLTLVVSSLWGGVVGLLTAVLANAALNYFFSQPLHRFAVADGQNVLGLVLFLAVSLLGDYLLARSRGSRREAEQRRAEAEVLLNLTRSLIGQTDPAAALEGLCTDAVRSFAARGAAILSAGAGGWSVVVSAGEAAAARPVDQRERSLVAAAASSRTPVGLGATALLTSRRPRIVLPYRRADADQRSATFLPLPLGDEVLGVLRLDWAAGRANPSRPSSRLLEAFGREAALALQRVRLARLAAQAESLGQADELKSRILAAVSHDLKTPLAGIKTAVTSLQHTEVSWSREDEAAFLATIDSQVDKLNHLISDILDLTRLDSGTVKPVLQAAPVGELIALAAERANLAAGGRKIVIDAPLGLVVQVDEGLIVQALANMLENGIKYSPAGTTLRIEAREHGGETSISVADEGDGIPEADLPYLFEPFYRSKSNMRRVPGTGLGLAIAKAFVEISGGHVRAENAGHGARFTITLPAAAPIEVPA